MDLIEKIRTEQRSHYELKRRIEEAADPVPRGPDKRPLTNDQFLRQERRCSDDLQPDIFHPTRRWEDWKKQRFAFGGAEGASGRRVDEGDVWMVLHRKVAVWTSLELPPGVSTFTDDCAYAYFREQGVEPPEEVVLIWPRCGGNTISRPITCPPTWRRLKRSRSCWNATRRATRWPSVRSWSS